MKWRRWVAAGLVAASLALPREPPLDGRRLVEEGNRLQASGGAEAASHIYSQATGDTRARATALFNLALMHARAGERAEAIEVFEGVIPRLEGTARARAHYNRGTLLAGQDRLDEALAELRRALVLDPGFGDARVNYEIVAARLPPPAAPRSRPSPSLRGAGSLFEFSPRGTVSRPSGRPRKW